MKVDAAILRRILAMPAEAMPAAILFLAEQLEQTSQGALRQRRYRERHQASQVTSPSVTKSVTSDGLARDVENNNNYPEDINKKNLSPSPLKTKKNQLPEEPKGFAEFWEAYPPRDGDRDRKAAVKAFTAALRREAAEAIIAGAKRYHQHCLSKGKLNTEFVKQARTWLNADAWKETYGAAGNGSSPQAIDQEKARAFLREHNARVAASRRDN